MSQDNTANVLVFKGRNPVSYEAKSFEWKSDSLGVLTSGTLDGYIDLALLDGFGIHTGTHTLTCDEARLLAGKLLAVADDVQKNCLFDLDPLLITHARPEDPHA